MSSTAPPALPLAAGRTAALPMPVPSASPAYSLFPPIPAPLQRLFDFVPLLTYPANALPGEAADSGDEDLPTLFVFTSPADAAHGRPSFNPTCLKWQTYLRLAGVPARVAPSTNHASPTGALPFLLPARRSAHRPAPRRPVPADDLQAFVQRTRDDHPDRTPSTAPLPKHIRVPAYQALLDTHVRRAWLHAVYLDPSSSSSSSDTIATRLYARQASASPVVCSALARQLRAAAAAQVWPGQRAHHHHQLPTRPDETARIYRDAEAALQALAALLDDQPAAPFFFGCHEPSLFDAAVFSYTHLLLEDDDSNNTDTRFCWHNRTLPNAVRTLPALVRHRTRILERCWPELAPTQLAAHPESPLGPSDSVVWVEA